MPDESKEAETRDADQSTSEEETSPSDAIQDVLEDEELSEEEPDIKDVISFGDSDDEDAVDSSNSPGVPDYYKLHLERDLESEMSGMSFSLHME